MRTQWQVHVCLAARDSLKSCHSAQDGPQAGSKLSLLLWHPSHQLAGGAKSLSFWDLGPLLFHIPGSNRLTPISISGTVQERGSLLPVHPPLQ